jgi:hypothetical protein
MCSLKKKTHSPCSCDKAVTMKDVLKAKPVYPCKQHPGTTRTFATSLVAMVHERLTTNQNMCPICYTVWYDTKTKQGVFPQLMRTHDTCGHCACKPCIIRLRELKGREFCCMCNM